MNKQDEVTTLRVPPGLLSDEEVRCIRQAIGAHLDVRLLAWLDGVMGYELRRRAGRDEGSATDRARLFAQDYTEADALAAAVMGSVLIRCMPGVAHTVARDFVAEAVEKVARQRLRTARLEREASAASPDQSNDNL